MKIYPSTKISELVKTNAAAVEAIASIATPLEKLKNPFLRRVMASRVTLAEAAEMGGCEIQELVAALAPLGFEYVEKMEGSESESVKGNTAANRHKGPEWLDQVNETFDVRPIISSGRDPLKEILHKYKELAPGSALCVENSFIPYPLISLLEGKGAETHSESEHAPLHRTYFYKPETGEKKQEPAPPATPLADPAQVVFHEEESYKRLLEQCDAVKWKEIDVRNLEMPQPMHTILEELEALPEERALFIRHKRVPVFLLEALADQPFDIHIYEVSEGDTRMLIIRGSKE